MEEQNFNQNQKVNYWMSLYTFYTSTATLKLTLIDNEGSVAVSIAPMLEGISGRPESGQKRYNYDKQMTFKLNIVEIQSIIRSYRSGILQNDQLTIFHKKNNGSSVLGSISTYNGRLQFSIKELVQGGAGVNYAFNNMETRKDSGNFIPAEFDCFIAILEGIIQNFVFLKSGLIKEYTPTNKQQNRSNTQYNNNNSGYNGNSSYNNQNRSYNNSGNNQYQQQNTQQTQNQYTQNNNGFSQNQYQQQQVSEPQNSNSYNRQQDYSYQNTLMDDNDLGF